jgi:hypothetical protein
LLAFFFFNVFYVIGTQKKYLLKSSGGNSLLNFFEPLF